MTNTNAAAQEKTEQAIIIGGGIGGLLAARVLSDYYREVLIVDKDDFPAKPGNRSGTPQAYHPHRLTPRGRMILDRLFPGFNEDLLAEGAPSSQNKTVHMTNPYGTFNMPNQENEATFSRALLEWVFRKRVTKIPNVRIRSKLDVVGLHADPDRTIVTGIRIGASGQSQQSILKADLVLDASGRSSKLTAWLQDLGYNVPEPDILKVSLRYSTCHYQLPPELAAKWDVIRVEGSPARKGHTGVFSIIENHVAEMLLWSVGGLDLIKTNEEFDQAVRQLADPVIAKILQGLEPLASPRGYRMNELYRQHFEKMKEWPSGLLVLGDALCNFDPIYGLGMTMAAVEADMLEQCLQEQQSRLETGFEQRLLQRLQDVIEPAWWLNCVADLQWPGVEYEGQPLQGIDFAQRYFNLFLQQATTKQNVEHFLLHWGVNALLFSPRVILNQPMVSSIIADASAADRQWFNDFMQKGGSSLEEQLDQIPSFSQGSFVPFQPES
ncbi:FAD dependent oxidoreductase [Paenibacillus sp. KQZ6P-2]|uniref:FAD dependent oxidoreductase n=1 Tax=Paenibacillus mangrovi TaxID=2931978 RepID=A0A9X1WL50_9BACL|nr:FAD-dependent monooxygenase [Paenibacillus mangrovi]MCJ8010884.1 FAD dependent oxidoreductase [Paenibacillus mangrovi]